MKLVLEVVRKHFEQALRNARKSVTLIVHMPHEISDFNISFHYSRTLKNTVNSEISLILFMRPEELKFLELNFIGHLSLKEETMSSKAIKKREMKAFTVNHGLARCQDRSNRSPLMHFFVNLGERYLH